MTTPFSLGRDINGNNAYSIVFSDTNYNMVLLQGVAQTVTIPDDYPTYRIVFTMEPGSTVWVASGTTAEAPTGAAALSLSQMNPAVRDVVAGSTLSLVTANDSAQVGVQIYAIQQW